MSRLPFEMRLDEYILLLKNKNLSQTKKELLYFDAKVLVCFCFDKERYKKKSEEGIMGFWSLKPMKTYFKWLFCENKTYFKWLFCENCSVKREYEIPLGTTIKEFIKKEVECYNCKCLLVYNKRRL